MDLNSDDLEDHYFPGKKREFRKESKEASKADRSKYKKSDADKKKKEPGKNKEGLKRGRVLSVFSQGVHVDIDGQVLLCSLRGALKKERTRQRRIVAVGDFVWVETLPGEEGVIVEVEERSSTLSRADTIFQRHEQVIAANIDQVLITVCIGLPSLRPFLIDRYIISALSGNMKPIIVINKIDLLDEYPDEKPLYEACLEAYEAAGYPILSVSTKEEFDLSRLKEFMKDRASVFSGQSGVGKSSLINEVTGLNLKTRSGIQKTMKGAHTTTRAKLIPLDFGGWCIDTPGIRSFGMWNLDAQEVKNYYPEFINVQQNCHFPNCTHTHEPDCAVKEGVEDKSIHWLRYESYLALIAELEEEHRPR